MYAQSGWQTGQPHEPGDKAWPAPDGRGATSALCTEVNSAACAPAGLCDVRNRSIRKARVMQASPKGVDQRRRGVRCRCRTVPDLLATSALLQLQVHLA